MAVVSRPQVNYLVITGKQEDGMNVSLAHENNLLFFQEKELCHPETTR